MTAVVITAALFFCNITPLKNAAKDSLPCPDNTNKFILFWVKYICIYISLLTSNFVYIGGGKQSQEMRDL